MRIYPPLKKAHLAVTDNEKCWICKRLFFEGQRTNLVPMAPGTGCVEAALAHATCSLRGELVDSFSGQYVIDRIKDGDASPYPVVTTDGKQWTFKELGINGDW